MSILAVRTGGLGDCLLTLPVFREITRHHPGHDLHILGNGMMREVSALSGFIEAIHDIDDPRYARLFGESPLETGLTEFFAQYSAHYFFSSTPYPDRFAERICVADVSRSHILDPRPPTIFTGHIVEHLMSIIPDHCPVYDPSDQPPMLAGVASHDRGDRTGLVIHPGSGSFRKNWPPDRFIKVADALGIPAAFVMGPAEHERGLADYFEKRRYPIASSETVRELAMIIDRAALFIGNDSGAAHLAGMLGVPSVVLFGPTDARVWRPLGTRAAFLQSPDGEMTGISVAQALDAAHGLMRSDPGAP